MLYQRGFRGGRRRNTTSGKGLLSVWDHVFIYALSVHKSKHLLSNPSLYAYVSLSPTPCLHIFLSLCLLIALPISLCIDPRAYRSLSMPISRSLLLYIVLSAHVSLAFSPSLYATVSLSMPIHRPLWLHIALCLSLSHAYMSLSMSISLLSMPTYRSLSMLTYRSQCQCITLALPLSQSQSIALHAWISHSLPTYRSLPFPLSMLKYRSLCLRIALYTDTSV